MEVQPGKRVRFKSVTEKEQTASDGPSQNSSSSPEKTTPDSMPTPPLSSATLSAEKFACLEPDQGPRCPSFSTEGIPTTLPKSERFREQTFSIRRYIEWSKTVFRDYDEMERENDLNRNEDEKNGDGKLTRDIDEMVLREKTRIVEDIQRVTKELREFLKQDAKKTEEEAK
jgi:hypothetical protein